MEKLNRENIRITLQSLAMVIIVIVTLAATSLIQIYYSRQHLLDEANLRAEQQMEATNLRITGVMDRVETVIQNNEGMVRRMLASPDSLDLIVQEIVDNNAFICGSSIALVKDYYPDRNPLFAPYAYRTEGEAMTLMDLGHYDYTVEEWFNAPLSTETGHWSEPYIDLDGCGMLIVTYSKPLYDAGDRLAGVVTADVSLKWFTDQVGAVEGYPGAISILASETGHLIVCPVPSLVMQRTIQQVAESLEDSERAGAIAGDMLAGGTGESPVLYRGEEEFVFYAPVKKAEWSMAIVIPRDEVYGSIRTLGRRVLLLQLLGALLLVYLLYAFARNQRNLREVSSKKERIEGELAVARDIQMSMLPKIFPPYPERDDLDLYGVIVPAREVGGDLYDFYIRDEKLFFCIGDVSGKGVPASLLMAVTRSLFRTASAHENSPQRIVTSLNDSMADLNESNMFVTFFIGVLDLERAHLRYCNAGHNAPLRTGPDGKAAPLDVCPNLALGVQSGFRYREQETDLQCGEGILLYTDGLTEAENAEHGLFGEKRLLQVAARGTGKDAEAQVKALVKAVRNHAGACPPSDDLTILSVRFVRPGIRPGTERHLILHNDITQIPQLADFVSAIASEAKLDQGLAMTLNLALEEAVSNVILYAYPKGSDGLVDVEAVIWDDHIDLIITDSGVPFDPTAAKDPNLDLDVSERPVGGLGIYLVKKTMDSVSYVRKDGKNILSMTKKLA